MKKKRMFIVIVIILLIGAGIWLKIYPVYHAYQELAEADCICFEGTYHVTDTSSIPSGSLLELLADGKVKGEYADGIFHGLLYTDGLDTALLEFYRNTNGEILLNIRQMIEFGADYMDESTSLPVKELFSLFDNSQGYFVSEEQFETITGIAILPSFDLVDSGSKVTFTDLISSNYIVYKNDKINLNLSDMDFPINLSIILTVSNSEGSVIEVPKSSIEEDQIWIYQMIFQKIMDIVSG